MAEMLPEPPVSRHPAENLASESVLLVPLAYFCGSSLGRSSKRFKNAPLFDHSAHVYPKKNDLLFRTVCRDSDLGFCFVSLRVSMELYPLTCSQIEKNTLDCCFKGLFYSWNFRLLLAKPPFIY